MHKSFDKHLGLGTARMKEDKATEEGKKKKVKICKESKWHEIKKCQRSSYVAWV